jgi:5-oxopent-3-ene-1,2,5-tricarboxylate decarboxylase / 2-hydroxyhepta-2,4-diene-1,7-dioate isomerase
VSAQDKEGISVNDDNGYLARTLAGLSTSLAADALRKHGADRLVMRGVLPLNPVAGTVAGRARTLRFLPSRADVAPPRDGKVRMRLIDDVKTGDVLVFDAMGNSAAPVFGDMVALAARRNGAAAVVTDGLMRDVAAIAEIGLPVFAAGVCPAPGPSAAIPWESDVPIQCGGVLVLPGDWVLADAEGAMVIPHALLSVVVEQSAAVTEEEVFCRKLIERGHPLAEVFPLPAALRPLYERYRQDGRLPSEAEVRGRV